MRTRRARESLHQTESRAQRFTHRIGVYGQHDDIARPGAIEQAQCGRLFVGLEPNAIGGEPPAASSARSSSAGTSPSARPRSISGSSLITMRSGAKRAAVRARSPIAASSRLPAWPSSNPRRRPQRPCDAEQRRETVGIVRIVDEHASRRGKPSARGVPDCPQGGAEAVQHLDDRIERKAQRAAPSAAADRLAML
jgi:hypothetical protein